MCSHWDELEEVQSHGSVQTSGAKKRSLTLSSIFARHYKYAIDKLLLEKKKVAGLSLRQNVAEYYRVHV